MERNSTRDREDKQTQATTPAPKATKDQTCLETSQTETFRAGEVANLCTELGAEPLEGTEGANQEEGWIPTESGITNKLQAQALAIPEVTSSGKKTPGMILKDQRQKKRGPDQKSKE